MLKNTFFITGAFISTFLNAQIVISSADMPTAGDSIIVSNASVTGFSDSLLTGANFTWDYSSLTPSSQQYEKFDAPQTFTSPFNFFFSTTNTTFGKNN